MKFQRAKLKFVARFNYGDALPIDEMHDGPFKVYGSNGPYASLSRSNTQGPVIIVGRKGSYGKVNWSAEPCFASDTTFFVDSSATKNDLRWLFWVLQTLGLDEGSYEAAVPGLNRETAYDIKVRIPSRQHQSTIASFLDNETKRLDTLITAKERLLDSLVEKQQTLIIHSVTRGVDSCVPLRDSGISWLGKIPVHWESRRAALLFRERDERGEPDLPLLEVSINSGVALREFSDDRIESTAADFNTYKVARQGDIVFNKMRMWQGAVGVAPQNGLVSPDYTVAKPIGPMSSAYAGQLFRTEMFSAECARNSHGIVWDRLRLYWDGFRDIVLPLLSLEEQAAIVAHIATETAKLDALRAATEQTIALLKERRSALIAAAVTGQLNIGEMT